MTTLVFLASLGALIVFILLLEADSTSDIKVPRRSGLFTWLTQGNWPAKLGGILVIVGVGALLRYALLNIDIPTQLKLASGIVIALGLAFGSTLVPTGPAKRPVSLALGGAAFGVAYLTAYSAFALFGYFSYPKGIALLAITAAAAGVYAVTRGALSMAMLAMVGAFLAPAFALQDPGPLVVYGYYAAASLLTLAMVTARGWRPLIHLSFLFTLAGGVFFAWTSQYYTTSHAAEMMPMIILLAAIHVAMPILEKNPPGTLWLERLDVVYSLLLPTTAALLGFLVASTRVQLSLEFMALGVIWGTAALALALLARPGTAVHAVIAAALFILGVIVRFRDLPWELVLLGFAVVSLAVLARRTPIAGRPHNILAGFVVLFGALHILSSNASPVVPVDVFLNGAFLERVIAAALLIVAGSICRRIRQSLDTLLLAVGILWLFISIGFEMIRWNLATVALIAHWFTILVAASLWIPGRRVKFADNHTTLLLVLILVTAWWASAGAATAVVLINACAASLAVLGIAVRPHDDDGDSSNGRTGAALIAPIVAFIWASQLTMESGVAQTYFGLTVAAVFSLIVMAVGHASPEDRHDWLDSVADIFFACFVVFLLKGTVLVIVRDTWAISLEAACMTGMVGVALLRRSAKRHSEFAVAACMLGVALIAQANLLRILGPERNLDITDVLDLKWPTAISLLWAIMGCALTLWSRKVASRSLWSAGAVVLVAAALKLLLVDFGSLGQLANILAVIAAGGVFLLVGWVAPMPPAAKVDASKHVESHDGARHRMVQRRRSAWSIAIVLFVVIASSDSSALLSYVFGRVRAHAPALNDTSISTEQGLERERRTAVVNDNSRDTELPAKLPANSPNASLSDSSSASPVQPSSVPPTATIQAPSSSAVVPAAPASSTPGAVERKSVARSEPTQPLPYTPPPTVDEHGVPTYTQFSLPQTESKRVRNNSQTIWASGDQGIEQLLREGLIRKATRDDLLALSRGDSRGASSQMAVESSRSAFLYRTYVVIAGFIYPSELTGAQAVTFVVPRGVATPTGSPGSSTVIKFP